MANNIKEGSDFLINEKTKIKEFLEIAEALKLTILVSIQLGNFDKGLILIESGEVTHAKVEGKFNGEGAVFYILNLENKIENLSNQEIQFEVFFLEEFDESIHSIEDVSNEDINIKDVYFKIELDDKFNDFIEKTKIENEDLIALSIFDTEKIEIKGIYYNESRIEKDTMIAFSDLFYAIHNNPYLKIMDKFSDEAEPNNDSIFTLDEFQLLNTDFLSLVKKINSNSYLSLFFNENDNKNKPFLLKKLKKISSDLMEIISE